MPRPRPALLPPAGPHGGDVVAVAAALERPVDELVDLSASLNPEPPALDAVIAAARGDLRRYPDATDATSTLAEVIGVTPERLVLTNGGAEAIALVAGFQPNGWVEAPEFSLYARHLATLEPDAPRWRSNPSNPLGRLAPASATAAVWDEAFWPLATGTWTRGDDDAWRLGSLTKLWACPGLRVGYAIAPTDEDATRLRARQPQWSVNALALAAVTQLAPMTDLPVAAAAMIRRRAALIELLAGHGLAVTETEANWVLVDRPGLRAELIPHGVLVRDCASFGLPGVHRIAVPDDRGFEHLDAALAQVQT